MAAVGYRREARLAALYYQGDYSAVRRETSSHMSDRRIRERERERESNERYTTTRKSVTIQRAGVVYSTRRCFESRLNHRDASFVGPRLLNADTVQEVSSFFASLIRQRLGTIRNNEPKVRN